MLNYYNNDRTICLLPEEEEIPEEDVEDDAEDEPPVDEIWFIPEMKLTYNATQHLYSYIFDILVLNIAITYDCFT